MKYVMSDIHGCYDEFISMLDLINFTEEDELYIGGDIFDRGKQPLDILDYIISHKNVHLIKGNHERMFEEFYETGDTSLWYMNGGETTLDQLSRKPYFFEEQLYRYIKKLPLYVIVDKYIIVHAGLYFPSNYKELTLEQILELQDEDTCLWDRSNIGSDKAIDGYTVICGHTPVQSITNKYKDVKIHRTTGHIYIDCGCVFKNAGGKLACLCLDTNEEFYI